MSSEQSPRILWSPSYERSESDCACPDGDVTPAMLYSSSSERTESDCACPVPLPAPITASPPPAALWQRPPHLYRAPLPQAHELAFNPARPVAITVLNAPARGILDTFTVPRPLTDATARQLAGLGLLAPDCAPQPAKKQLFRKTQNPAFAVSHKMKNTAGVLGANPDVAPHTLTAWLHVTSRCNLRCAYCYVPRSDATMSLETGRAAVDAVFRSALAHGFRAVKLKYAGGEPALNWPLVRTLHRHAVEQAAQSGLELREVVLSNGTLLTGEMVDWLRGEDVRLMISLDGIGAAHDAQRPFADGRGSFAQVARNVDRALARGLSPYLSITVTARNAGGLADAVTFALERDLLFNLNFVREPGVGQVANLSNGDARLIAGLKAALAVIETELPRRRLIDALVDRSVFGAPHEHPCGAGLNYLVIAPHGRVVRCQMTMAQPVTDVWADDPLHIVRGWRDGFQNIPVDEKEGCRDCTWRYWCAGGCPLLAHCTTGRSDVPSPYCAVYKALYPDVLRLEGLRLLKWQLPPS